MSAVATYPNELPYVITACGHVVEVAANKHYG